MLKKKNLMSLTLATALLSTQAVTTVALAAVADGEQPSVAVMTTDQPSENGVSITEKHYASRERLDLEFTRPKTGSGTIYVERYDARGELITSRQQEVFFSSYTSNQYATSYRYSENYADGTYTLKFYDQEESKTPFKTYTFTVRDGKFVKGDEKPLAEIELNRTFTADLTTVNLYLERPSDSGITWQFDHRVKYMDGKITPGSHRRLNAIIHFPAKMNAFDRQSEAIQFSAYDYEDGSYLVEIYVGGIDSYSDLPPFKTTTLVVKDGRFVPSGTDTAEGNPNQTPPKEEADQTQPLDSQTKPKEDGTLPSSSSSSETLPTVDSTMPSNNTNTENLPTVDSTTPSSNTNAENLSTVDSTTPSSNTNAENLSTVDSTTPSSNANTEMPPKPKADNTLPSHTSPSSRKTLPEVGKSAATQVTPKPTAPVASNKSTASVDAHPVTTAKTETKQATVAKEGNTASKLLPNTGQVSGLLSFIGVAVLGLVGLSAKKRR